MKTFEAVEILKNNHQEMAIQEVVFFDETTLHIDKENLHEVLKFLKTELSPSYEVLMDLTAVDYLEPDEHTKIVYWLHNPINFERVRIIVTAKRDETIPSVTSLWKGADWYEREIFDLFGVEFEGHPDLKRILMPDDWKGHPLRRNYPLTEEPVEFKHGVKPKVPSEIIHLKRNQKYK